MRARWTPWLPAVLAVVVLLGGALILPASTAPAPAPAATIVPATATSSSSSAGSTASRPNSNASVEVAPGYPTGSGVTDLGPTPSSVILNVAVGLPSANPGGLAAFVTASSIPGSIDYRSFVAAATADARYGASSASVAAARAYFDRFGLMTTVPPGGLLIEVQGPATAVGQAFGTTFDTYARSSGGTFVSHPGPATLPADLGTDGVFGLDNQTGFLPEATTVAATSPAGSCSGPSGGLSPCAIATAYDIAPLEQNGTNGSGERLAVVDAYAASESQDQLTSDLTSFVGDSALEYGAVDFLYPVPTTADLNQSGTNSGWALEDALDLEWARASAPGATIEMTFSPNSGDGLYEAIDWLVAEDAANVVSMSWGEPDTGTFNAYDTPCSSACNATSDGSYAILGPVLELGAAEGISFFAASGDCGAADGTSGVATNFPASDPYVTGVGGTVLSVAANDSWAGESAWSGNSTGGTSPGCVNQGGSGGGFSPLPEPWYQDGITDPSGDRGVPDVAMDADTPVGTVVDGADEGVIGTSVGTPIWAGLGAIADQYAGASLGLLNPGLYAILRSTNYSSDFHDITEGSNGYSAGPGWDPVTGIGTPIAQALVPALVRGGGIAGRGLATDVFATPRSGHVPLTVSMAMNASGGTGTYSVEGISFGDGTSQLYSGGIVNHTYGAEGPFLVQSFAADSSGNTSVSLPVLVEVEGTVLTVNLSVSSTTAAVGSAVTFSATVTGGTAPYSYSFYFGDGSDALTSAASADHAYELAGSYCAEVAVEDSALVPDGGISARVAVAVGGAATPSCASGTTPLVVTPNATGRVLDAPADYGSSLFTVSGGVGGPAGLPTSIAIVSNDSYIQACGCTIFRHAGNYTATEWANDSVDGSAEATENVTVGPPLDATFAASTLFGFAPLKVYFFSSVKGGEGANASTTRWSFGNGASAVGHSVNTTYEAPGEYLALGQLSDLGEGNASELFLVDVAPPAGALPLGLTATISPAVNVTAGAAVRFSATPEGPASDIANTLIYWNFGNGRSAFGSPVSETFEAPTGPLTNNTLLGEVTLETTYLEPIYTAGFHLAPFLQVESGGFVPRVDALSATANVTPLVNLVPFDIFGNATADGPRPWGFVWNFGDGTTEDGPVAQHTLYASQGYTVTTQVTNGWGDSATFLTGITANGPLGVAGTPVPGTGPKPLSVTIATAAYGGKGPPYRYAWTFANGTHATTATVHLYFPQIGTYVFRLNVTDRAGDVAEKNFTIVVGYPLPYVPLAIVLGSAGVGALVAVVSRFRRPPKSKPGEDPWLDHPRTASDGTPVW